MLILKKPRLDFSKAFTDFIKSYRPVVYNTYSFYDGMDDYDEEYWDDLAYLNYFRNCSSNNKAKTKSKAKSRYKSYGKKTSKKYGRYNDIDFFEGHSHQDDDDNLSLGREAKTIFFYNDINNPDDYEEFYNLFDFDEYLQANGIHISEYEVQKLINRDISHCCVCNTDGEAMLVSDNTYGSLYYEASECLYS